MKIVRRIKAGVSITLHFTNAREAERAIKTALGAPARVVLEES